MKSNIFWVVILFISIGSYAQTSSDEVWVDKNGVMQWKKAKKEVQGFGVNYTVPFAHAYRSAKRLNVSPQEAIDQDVYHFARLGFDAYRVHVWDIEISDTVGNLLDNNHLQLFDYMVHKMKQRGMKFILTPIAFWGNGYPEPAEKTPGFAYKYGKEDCLTNEGAIQAQENYLFQFLNHVNPHTGFAYKDDPDIIAFEISNEPHHKEGAEKVTIYINRLVSSMRKTGCQKLIFYNVSHSINLVDAYYTSDIQGGTFQWYPTGLGSQEELGGNLLPNVDRYTIPFADHAGFKKNAKIVYEFDAADVGRSYIYPAMARSFREAGIQWATHFAYDPTYMAYANTEYNTHYMNLVYAPQKALSLKLASEVFHDVPLYKDYGRYPANTRFANFHVSYEDDLAELVTDRKFIYTNHTKATIPSPTLLQEIAGFGNSTIVKYEGTGAYFLDRIENGVWRLEVMPDALWVSDPFGKNSLEKAIAVVNWRPWPMTINLPDLGIEFDLMAINDNNEFKTSVANGSFTIAPGTYLLTKKGTKSTVKKTDQWSNIVLNEFSAPKSTLKNIDVIHNPPSEINAGSTYTITATIVTAAEPQSVDLFVLSGYRPVSYKMRRTTGYQYAFTLPADQIKKGFLHYFITVNETGSKEAITFPCAEKGNPTSWNFNNRKPYEVNVVDQSSPLYLFNALTDYNETSYVWNRGISLVPRSEPGKAEMVIVPESMKVDNGDSGAPVVYDYSLRYYFRNKIKARADVLMDKKKMVLRGRSINTKRTTVQIALITKQGVTYGASIAIEPDLKDYSFSWDQLKKVKLVTLPRPYPTFLPYFFDNTSTDEFRLEDVETLQISIGPGIAKEDLQQPIGFAVESIRLQ